MEDQVLITVEETGRRLALSRSTVYTLIRQGDLRPVHVGRAIRLLARDVVEYAERLAAAA